VRSHRNAGSSQHSSTICLSGCNCVKRLINLLCNPDPVKENRELSGYCHNCPSTRMAAASRTQAKPPPTQGGVFTPRSDDMVGAFDQELAEISIAGFCDSKLRIAVTRLASTRSQSQVAADVAASLKSLFLSQRQHEGQRCQMANPIYLDQGLCLRVGSLDKLFDRSVVLLDLHRHISDLMEQRAQVKREKEQGDGRNAGPSTSLRFGRDDKG
jgi:hypothetical protein